MKRTFSCRLMKSLAPALLALACGCSTVPVAGPDAVPPMRQYTVPAGVKPLLVVDDPVEGFNRGTYKFNYYFDKYLFLPVVRTYDFVLPDYVQDRVSCFVDNIGEFDNFYNNLLQAKFKSAGITLGRFVGNTTVGIAGLWDPATHWGWKRQEEDLGQTLGHYGIGNGAYLVLPVLGPANVRDAVGMAGDTAVFNTVGPAAMVDDDDTVMAYSGVTAVDTRYRVPFRYQQTGSPFEYELVRMLYTIKRDMDVGKKRAKPSPAGD
jgi:phospholipid-binding lipoprotein MlaA